MKQKKKKFPSTETMNVALKENIEKKNIIMNQYSCHHNLLFKLKLFAQHTNTNEESNGNIFNDEL